MTTETISTPSPQASARFWMRSRIVRSASVPRRVAALFVKLAVRHPSLAWLANAFFRLAYYPLTGARDALHE